MSWRSDKAGLAIKYSLQTSTPGKTLIYAAGSKINFCQLEKRVTWFEGVQNGKSFCRCARINQKKIPVKLGDKIKDEARTQFPKSEALSVKNPDNALILFDWIQKNITLQGIWRYENPSLETQSSVWPSAELRDFSLIVLLNRSESIETILSGKRRLGRAAFPLALFLPERPQSTKKAQNSNSLIQTSLTH